MDKDMTRLMVEGAAKSLYGIKREVKRLVPYGPGKVHMTAGELRAKFSKMAPDQFKELMQYLGPEQAMQLLIGMRPKRPRELDEFLQEEV